MEYEILGKKISGPFTIPSGILTTQISVLEKIAKEIPEIGILTTKSIGVEKREGNREPIIAQIKPFTFINAVGLRNPGVEKFAKEISKIKIPKEKFLLFSIFGKDEREFERVAEKLKNLGDGFELNLSCPHAKNYGKAVGENYPLVEKIVKKVAKFKKPVFIKISPNLNIKETLKRAIRGGISGIVAINTKGPESFIFDGHFVLSNKIGGISGREIFKLGIKCVKEIRKFTKLPIIACGGILTAKDVREYQKAGANFFGIGSALAGMTTKEVKFYFHELMEDLKRGTNNAERFLKENGNRYYKKFKVKEKIFLDKETFLLKLEGKLNVKPGQFVFLWLPKKGEKPFSVLDDFPLSFLIKIRGFFTNQISQLKKGDNIYLRGPYGNSPQVKGKILLVGGGTGIAGLYLFAKENKENFGLFSFSQKSFLNFLPNFEKRFQKIFLVTGDNKKEREKKFIHLLRKIIPEIKPDFCLNCGSKLMVEKSIEIEKDFLPPQRILSSFDIFTPCGIGLCGYCATKRGLRNCVDGTFFTPTQI